MPSDLFPQPTLTKVVDLRGFIGQLNQEEKTFVLKRSDEIEAAGRFDGDHYENIVEAVAGYRCGVKLAIQGVGTWDRSDNRNMGSVR